MGELPFFSRNEQKLIFRESLRTNILKYRQTRFRERAEVRNEITVGPSREADGERRERNVNSSYESSR